MVEQGFFFPEMAGQGTINMSSAVSLELNIHLPLCKSACGTLRMTRTCCDMYICRSLDRVLWRGYAVQAVEDSFF